MHRIHAQRGGLAWLLFLGAMTTGCEEWWGEEEEPLEDAGNPIVPGDAAVDSGPSLVDAGLPDAAPGVDASVIIDAAADASPALDAAPPLPDAAQSDAAPDAATPDAAAPDAAAQDAAPDAAPGTLLPCDVAQVVKARCQSCHGDPPTGAPFKLVTLADFKAPSAAGGFVFERVQVRIDSTAMPMPPTWSSTGALTSAERASLTNWILTGAPGSNVVCP
jgi:cytochrome c5